MSRRTCLPGLFAGSLAACGPSPGTGAEGSSGGSTGGSSGATSTGLTTSGTEATTGEPTSDAATTDAPTTSGSSTGASSTGGEELCPGPDEPAVQASWEVRFLDAPTPLDFNAPCEVTAVTEAPSGMIIALACPLGDTFAKVELEWARTPAQALAGIEAGKTFILAYREEQPWWIDRWFALRHADNEPFLAGIDGHAIVPPGTTAAEFFGFDLALATGLCAPERETCGLRERAALELVPFGTPVLVLDGQFVEVFDLPGSVWAWVDELTLISDPVCDDLPELDARVLLEAAFGP